MNEFYLDEQDRPRWFDADVWDHLSPDQRERVRDHALKSWEVWLEKHSARGRAHPEAAAEEFVWRHRGMPDGEGSTPQTTLLDHGFGLGRDAWIEYNEGQNAAQYLNLKEVLGAGYPASPHFNLCGELTVSSVLGMPMEEGLRLFSHVTTSERNDQGQWVKIKGEKILKDKFYTTSAHQLGHFFKEAGWTSETLTSVTPTPSPATPVKVDALLDENKSLVTLVNIDGAKGGILAPVEESTRKIAHWVTVLSVIQAISGESIVRLYNPFQNREEIYSWDYFVKAWSRTHGNMSRNLVIIATPPSTQEGPSPQDEG